MAATRPASSRHRACVDKLLFIPTLSTIDHLGWTLTILGNSDPSDAQVVRQLVDLDQTSMSHDTAAAQGLVDYRQLQSSHIGADS